jgi:hypothetical protein
MKPRANRVVPLRVALGVAVAGLLAVPLALPARADGPSDSDGGFVLLSMEQAAMYRGTQMPGYCRGTGNQPQCTGTSTACWQYSYENCPSFARSFPTDPVRYCQSWTPGGPAYCDFQGEVPCYTDSGCMRKSENGTCVRPGFPLGWTNVVKANDDVCTAGPGQLPPPEVPLP